MQHQCIFQWLSGFGTSHRIQEGRFNWHLSSHPSWLSVEDLGHLSTSPSITLCLFQYQVSFGSSWMPVMSSLTSENSSDFKPDFRFFWPFALILAVFFAFIWVFFITSSLSMHCRRSRRRVRRLQRLQSLSQLSRKWKSYCHYFLWQMWRSTRLLCLPLFLTFWKLIKFH